MTCFDKNIWYLLKKNQEIVAKILIKVYYLARSYPKQGGICIMKSSLSTSAADTKTAANVTANETVEAKKEEVKAVKTETEKKPAAKKTATAKKAATKKTSETNTTTTAKKTAKKAVEVTPSYILQFSGKEIATDDILANVKTAWVEKFQGKLDEINSIEIYVKPEEHRAYFVVNGLSNGDYFVEL